MKFLFVFILILPSLAVAQSDLLVFFTGTDLAPEYPTEVFTSIPFEWITIHLGILNPSLGGVSGWECDTWTEGLALAPLWSIPSCGIIPECSMPPFQIDIGFDPNSLEPSSAGLVYLGSWTAGIPFPTEVVSFHIGPVPGSVSFPDSPGYAGPTPESGLASLTTIQGGASIPVFSINQETVEQNNASWSAVKALYR